ncbi:hypothetical protein CIT26_25645 [Mesorhizobium temperatum]|uniref:Cyclic nucleotide-binding domain-containing protein n=2 Tax=Mesorhizobium temperatum TaxID=241416 RepID=A0A271LGK4_9HYPH|nr:hypothetical protein CIT26_25645 [Mesorhizobium temperatum]
MSYLDHVEFPKGAVLCRAGDPAGRLWMLTRGCISVWVSTPGGRRRLASITVGEMGFLTERARSTDAIADEDVVAYKLTSSVFNKITKARPHIAQGVLRSIARQPSPTAAQRDGRPSDELHVTLMGHAATRYVQNRANNIDLVGCAIHG